MSLSLRRSVVRSASGRIRCRVIALARLNSRSPSAPWIRPKPESPLPPNGSAGTLANVITALTRSSRCAGPARRPGPAWRSG